MSHSSIHKRFTEDKKETIDYAMEEFDRDLTTDEIKGLFFSKNPTLTTSQKHQYELIFKQIESSSVVGSDVANQVLSSMFRQFVGQEVANLGFQYVNGDMTTLEPLRGLIESYQEDFTPKVKADFVDNSVENLINSASSNTKYRFNINSLFQAVEDSMAVCCLSLVLGLM